MKKTFFAKITSILLAVCFAFGSFSVVPAYAMENENATNVTNVYTVQTDDAKMPVNNVSDGIVPYSGHDQLIYGQTIDVLADTASHSFTFTGSNTTPYKIVSSDPRVHRMIFALSMYQVDNISNTASVTVTIHTQYHGDYECDWSSGPKGSDLGFTNNPAVTGVETNLLVSPGERVWFEFRANGSNRQIKVTDFALYCD